MSRQSNITIDQGTDVTFNIVVNDNNGNPLLLVGYTANAEIRHQYQSANMIPFVATVNTTANPNFILLTLSANQTANLTYTGRYVYDVTITNANTGQVARVVEGICTIRPSATH